MASDDALSDMQLTVNEFISDLRENIFTSATDRGDILLVEFFFKKMDSRTLMNHIVAHVLPYAEEIKNRNLNFFNEEKRNIFAGLPNDRVDYFASLLNNDSAPGSVNAENKTIIWQYFDTMVAISKNYKKNI
jgi:hypothetical protein